MEVRVIREHCAEARAERDYLRVQTFTDPEDDTVTLATIERVVQRTKREPNRAEPVRLVRPLVVKRPMSEEEALVLARSYAEHKNIPVVYAEEGRPS
ncbi:MAG TPA: hypothetical protein VF322_01795 [Gammaproteobacteria bacterium]